MDIPPAVPRQRQMVERYGAGRFTISGQLHQGSVLVLPEKTYPWSATSLEEMTLENLRPILEAANTLDVLLLGCGRQGQLLPKAWRESLRREGLVVEVMDTGAAARTFNVLMTEERRAAAALIAVD